MCLELFGYKMFIFRCNLAGEQREGGDGPSKVIPAAQRTAPLRGAMRCVAGITSKALPALTFFPRKVTFYMYARSPSHT